MADKIHVTVLSQSYFSNYYDLVAFSLVFLTVVVAIKLRTLPIETLVKQEMAILASASLVQTRTHPLGPNLRYISSLISKELVNTNKNEYLVCLASFGNSSSRKGLQR